MMSIVNLVIPIFESKTSKIAEDKVDGIIWDDDEDLQQFEEFKLESIVVRHWNTEMQLHSN